MVGACSPPNNPIDSDGIEVVVLGVAQDAGYPQVACDKECCRAYYRQERPRQRVVCLGIIDRDAKSLYMLEATPDFVSQWHDLQEMCPECNLQGIIVSHAHIGHYTGLMYLGHESMGAKDVPVYAMPRMRQYLHSNGPWSQLITHQNIRLLPMADDSTIVLSPNLQIKAMLVPHRDEYSETVAIEVSSSCKKMVFLPDIDKWEKWDRSLGPYLAQIDIAFLDATFYSGSELPGRDMSTVPHPFVIETLALLQSAPAHDRAKIHFLHFNHTNPIMNSLSINYKEVEASGFNIAIDGQIHHLENHCLDF
jgi:pyrroloquinoline quinone biosynthesis protein B